MGATGDGARIRRSAISTPPSLDPPEAAPGRGSPGPAKLPRMDGMPPLACDDSDDACVGGACLRERESRE